MLDLGAWASAAICLGLSLLLTPVAAQLLRRWKVLDHPSERSLHEIPTPRGGGVGPLVAALAAFALSSQAADPEVRGIALAAGLLGFLGVVEDLRGLRSIYRLGLQMAVSFVAAPVLLSSDRPTQLLLVAVASLWITSYVNVFNFMDGANGISVAQVLAAGVPWYLIGDAHDLDGFAFASLVIVAAAAGFAPSNFPRAAVFLGDTGSYFFGAWLAGLSVAGWASGLTPEAVIAPLALYLADTGTTLLRRFRQGKLWYLPHREHCYQLLILRGWSHARVAMTVLLLTVTCSALGAVTLRDSVRDRVLADLALVVVVALYLAVGRREASKTSSD
jgi:UDP-GlcNAc:undecaprenyl-phosphate/decaprenyl-phosphate GlcNAc-1-phosphate transferase